MTSKDALAKTILIGLSNDKKKQLRLIWVASGKARYGLFDPFYLG